MVKMKVYRANKFLGYLAVNEPEDKHEFVSIFYYAPKYKKNKTVVLRTKLESDGSKVILAGKCTDKTLLNLGLSTNG